MNRFSNINIPDADIELEVVEQGGKEKIERNSFLFLGSHRIK